MSENPYAFPMAHAVAHNGQYGMTLRDWFAGQVVTMPTPTFWKGEGSGGLRSTPEAMAERAYAVADAMLAERSKPGVQS